MADKHVDLNEKREKRRELLLNGSIPSVVTKMAVPTILSSLTASLYNMADTFFVSGLGTAATAAVGVNNSLMQFIQMFGTFIAIGSGSYISRLLGGKRDEEASEILSTAFFVCFGMGLLVMTSGLIFMEPLVRLLGATEEVVPYSKDYALYILLAAPLSISNFCMNYCLRSEGSATYSAAGMMSGNIVNLFLDPYMITNLGYGVAGAAMATAISKVVSFVILIMPYLTRRSLLELSFKKIHFYKEAIIEVTKIGLPTLMRTGCNTAANIVTNNLAGNFSTSALAAVSVVNRLMQFVNSAIQGFGHGFQTVAGFNWGAKRYDRVKSSFRFAAMAGGGVACTLAILVIIFPAQLMGLFTEMDTEMITIGVFSLRCRSAVMPFHVIVMVSQSMFTAIGKAKQAMVLSLSRQGICLIPSVVVLSLVFGVMGLACSQALADVLAFCIAAPLSIGLFKAIKNAENESVSVKNA